MIRIDIRITWKWSLKKIKIHIQDCGRDLNVLYGKPYGVLQGSLLGPVFLLYIKDIDSVFLKSLFYLYADLANMAKELVEIVGLPLS